MESLSLSRGKFPTLSRGRQPTPPFIAPPSILSSPKTILETKILNLEKKKKKRRKKKEEEERKGKQRYARRYIMNRRLAPDGSFGTLINK